MSPALCLGSGGRGAGGRAALTAPLRSPQLAPKRKTVNFGHPTKSDLCLRKSSRPCEPPLALLAILEQGSTTAEAAPLWLSKLSLPHLHSETSHQPRYDCPPPKQLTMPFNNNARVSHIPDKIRAIWRTPYCSASCRPTLAPAEDWSSRSGLG